MNLADSGVISLLTEKAPCHKGDRMSTLIVSDLHIGDFKSGHMDLIRALERQPDVRRLIIAGDLFDLWVAGPGRALKEAQYLLDYLDTGFKGEVIYLTGNHDEDFRYLKSLNGIPVKDFHTIKWKDKRILVFHGHQYDKSFYLDKVGVLARFNAWLVNKTDKLFNMDARKWLISLSEGIENDPYDKMIFTYEHTLQTEFSGVHDVVITGHTHLPVIKRLNGLIYINCGDFMQHRTGVIYEEELGSFSLVDFSNKGIHTISEIKI